MPFQQNICTEYQDICLLERVPPERDAPLLYIDLVGGALETRLEVLPQSHQVTKVYKDWDIMISCLGDSWRPSDRLWLLQVFPTDFLRSVAPTCPPIFLAEGVTGCVIEHRYTPSVRVTKKEY